MLKFNSKDKQILIEKGKLIDDKNRSFIREGIGARQKKVEAKRHTVISGPPGVGKSYGTIDECRKAKKKYVFLAPGTSDIAQILKVAYGVYNLKSNEELIVILDDADDLMFGTYEDLNKWKIALAKPDPTIGSIPTLNHQVDFTKTLSSLEKQGKQDLIDACSAFMSEDELGIKVPTDRCRFIVLCNLDLEDPKAFRSAKMRSAVSPVLDRLRYQRINLTDDDQWGWLAYVLGTTQPFEEASLSNNQKIELLNWMYPRWDILRSQSYRTVESLAEEMINNPTDYEDKWQDQLKGH